jgi:uroporphyrinogen-III synthase
MSAPRRRVLVTRDESLNGALSSALIQRGFDPVACGVIANAPTTEPEALERAARSLEQYEWLIVASQRAVAALMAARPGHALPPGLRTAAVGQRSAAALVAAGATAPLTAASAGAVALIAVLRVADRWHGRRVLLPRALHGGRDIAGSLRLQGADVDEVVAYTTVSRPRSQIVAAWEAARPDAAVVASPSAARALVQAVGAERLRRLARVAALGSTTAMQLVALGVPAVVPARADFDAVAELLLGAFTPEVGS